MKIKLFLQPLKTIFADLPVRACYLYGSQTEEHANMKSDFDLAVIVGDKDKIDYRNLLSKAGASFFNAEKLHLTVVNLTSSSPLLLFQIIKKGRLLYEKQQSEHIRLESLIMRLYFDDQYRNAVYYQKLKDHYVS